MNFLQAVREGNLVAAKSAFNAEMASRVATTLATMKNEIANSVQLPEEFVSGGKDDAE